MLKNPQHRRTRFYNKILPSVYAAAYPNLQTRFESFFFKERAWRFDFVTWVEDLKSKFESKVNPNNPAAIGKFLQPNYTSSKPADAHLCSKGIEELKAVLDELEEKNEELKSVRSSLFVNNAIKAGMTEKNEFLLEAIAQVENEKIRISEAVTSMTKSLEMLRKTTKGLPIKKIGDSKKRGKTEKKCSPKKGTARTENFGDLNQAESRRW